MKKCIIYLFLLVTFLSCEDFLTRYPVDDLSQGSIWQTEADMQYALNNLYQQIPAYNDYTGEDGRDQYPDRCEYLYTAYTDDGWVRTLGRLNPDLNFNSESRPMQLDYGRRYNAIRDCNEFIFRAPDADIDEELRTRMIAEARFIRALHYARLNFLYGAVPLIEEPITADVFPKRATQDKVFAFVNNEFQLISLILSEKYTGNDIGRVTSGAALAMKARHLLNAIDWYPDLPDLYKQAREACQAIYDSKVYTLEDGIEGFKRIFSTETDNDASPSSETVLIVVYDPTFRMHSYMNTIAPKGAYSGTRKNTSNYMGVTSVLLERFQMDNGKYITDPTSGYDPANPWLNRDPRLEVTVQHAGEWLPAKGGDGVTPVYKFDPHPSITPPTDSGGVTTDDVGGAVNPTGYNYEKYTHWDWPHSNQCHNDYKFIRYAEVLLMYAEAVLGETGDITKAMSYVDEVRTRVGMPDVATSYGAVASTDDALDIILQERRTELATEGPHRFFDIRRHRLGEEVFADPNVYGIPVGSDRVPDTAVLEGDLDVSKRYLVGTRVFNPETYYQWPIPQDAVDANPNLLEEPE